MPGIVEPRRQLSWRIITCPDVSIPDTIMGHTRTSIARKRGRSMGTTPIGDWRPMPGMLAALTGGTGTADTLIIMGPATSGGSFLRWS